jgi:hypothetical protein
MSFPRDRDTDVKYLQVPSIKANDEAHHPFLFSKTFFVLEYAAPEDNDKDLAHLYGFRRNKLVSCVTHIKNYMKKLFILLSIDNSQNFKIFLALNHLQAAFF